VPWSHETEKTQKHRCFSLRVCNFKENKMPKMDYLIEHHYKIQNDLHPEYYTTLKFKCPTPQKGDDKPVILVGIYNAKKSIMLAFASVEKLNRIFDLDSIQEGLKEDLEIRLQTATDIRDMKLKLETELKEENTTRP